MKNGGRHEKVNEKKTWIIIKVASAIFIMAIIKLSYYIVIKIGGYLWQKL